jgi:hypothetical protein
MDKAEQTIFYFCDPNKNTTCKKRFCHNPCFMTLNASFAQAGTGPKKLKQGKSSDKVSFSWEDAK